MISSEDNNNVTSLNEGVTSMVQNLVALNLLRIISIPWEKQKAYECGIIDGDGKRIHTGSISQECKKHYTLIHKIAYNLKRLLNKVPGVGQKAITSYIGALLLLKEDSDFDHLSDEDRTLLSLFVHDQSAVMTDSALVSESVIIDESLAISLLPEDATVSTDAVGNLNIAPIRKFSLFDVDSDEFSRVRNNPFRKPRQRWKHLINPENINSPAIKKCWNNGDLVFLRDSMTGEVRAVSPKFVKNTTSHSIRTESTQNQTSSSFMDTNTTTHQKSFNDIMDLLVCEDSPSLFSLVDQEVDELFTENEQLFAALNELHSMGLTEDAEDESVFVEMAEQYDVDPIELRLAFNEERMLDETSYHDHSSAFDTDFFYIKKIKDMFLDYKSAVSALHRLIQKERQKGGPMKSIEFYAQKLDHMIAGKFNPKKLAALYRKEYTVESLVIQENGGRMITEKLNPEDDASVWIKDFIDSDAPQFDGKSKEKRKEMALAAWYAARRESGIEEAVLFHRTIMLDSLFEQFVSVSFDSREDRESFIKENDNVLDETNTKIYSKKHNKLLVSQDVLGECEFSVVSSTNVDPYDFHLESILIDEQRISDEEFDEILSSFLNTRLGDDFIDAMENDDEKAMIKIIDAEIDNDKKSKEIVKKILKNR
jgi:hypothetical protein